MDANILSDRQIETSVKPPFDANVFFNVTELKQPVLILGLSLLGGVGADLLLLGKPVGVSYPLAYGLFAALLMIAVTKEGRRVTQSNLWLLLAALLLATMSVVRAAPFVRTLNILGSLGFGILFVRGVVGRPVSSQNFGDYLRDAVYAGLGWFPITFPFLVSVGAHLKQIQVTKSPTFRKVLTGLLLTIPLLIIFTTLFAAADLIFGGMVRSALEALYIENLLGHIVLSWAISWLFTGLIVFAVTRNDEQLEPLPHTERQLKRFRVLGSIESSMVLFSVNGLFVLFVAVQFAALFGGQGFIEARGLTYSEYARRGFFELVTVAVIVMGLILLLDLFTKRESGISQRVFLTGCTLLVAMTVVVLASAFQRMALYERAFGFTQLRILTHIFIVWLAIMLSAFLMMLYQKRTYMFATGLVIGTLAYIMTLNVINPEAFVARQNVLRYESGDMLDVEYTDQLSADAVPVLVALLEDDDARDAVGPWLAWRLHQLDRRQENYQWPAYHVSINRAYSLLDAEREVLDTFDLSARYAHPEIQSR